MLAPFQKILSTISQHRKAILKHRDPKLWVLWSFFWVKWGKWYRNWLKSLKEKTFLILIFKTIFFKCLWRNKDAWEIRLNHHQDSKSSCLENSRNLLFKNFFLMAWNPEYEAWKYSQSEELKVRTPHDKVFKLQKSQLTQNFVSFFFVSKKKPEKIFDQQKWSQ